MIIIPNVFYILLYSAVLFTRSVLHLQFYLLYSIRFFLYFSFVEREGRFVHRIASECGIHTRLSSTRKAPHGGGSLINLLGNNSSNNNPSNKSSSKDSKKDKFTTYNKSNITSSSGGIVSGVAGAGDALIDDPNIALTAGIDFNHVVELNERQVSNSISNSNNTFTKESIDY